MGFFNICKDPVTVALKETFNATPLKVPESRVKPLEIVARKGKKTNFWGAMRHLFEGSSSFAIKNKESVLADVTISKTRSMDFDFGLKILDGFLKGFGIPSLPIETSLKGAKKISFSFKNTKRLYVEPSYLGRKLMDKKMDFRNPALGIFLKEGDAFDMLLITSVIVSDGFSIHVESSSNPKFNIEVPAVDKLIGSAKTKIDIKKENDRTISFQGEEPLTFAFSTIKLDVNSDGTISMGEFMPPRAEGEEPVFIPYDEETVQEEDEDVLLEWD